MKVHTRFMLFVGGLQPITSPLCGFVECGLDLVVSMRFMDCLQGVLTVYSVSTNSQKVSRRFTQGMAYKN